MDANRLTQRSQAALNEAQAIATRLGHTEADADHLLAALLDQEDGLLYRYTPPAGSNDHRGQVSWLPDRRSRPPSRARGTVAVGRSLPGHSCGGSGGIAPPSLFSPVQPGQPVTSRRP